jgi:hypothetical protein
MESKNDETRKWNNKKQIILPTRLKS